MDARSCPPLPDAAPPPSLPRPPPVSSRSHRCPPLWPRAGGGSLPLGRGLFPQLVAAPLPVLVARDPLPDPRGRSRLPLVVSAPSFAPVVRSRCCRGGAGQCQGNSRASCWHSIHAFGGLGVLRGSTSSIFWTHVSPYLRVALRRPSFSFRWRHSLCEAARHLYAKSFGPRGPTS